MYSTTSIRRKTNSNLLGRLLAKAWQSIVVFGNFFSFVRAVQPYMQTSHTKHLMEFFLNCITTKYPNMNISI